MTAYLMMLILALGSQLGPRYGDAATGTGDGAAPAAAPAGSEETPAADDAPAGEADPAASTITLPPESPEPTLAADSATDSGAAAAPATDAAATDGTATDDTSAAAAAFAAPPADAAPADSAPPAAVLQDPPAEAPAASAQSSDAQSSDLVAPRPADLIRQYTITPQIGQLPGVPMPLGAAMQGAVDRQTQTQRAQAYWTLSAAVTQYYLALQESLELSALRQGVANPAVPVWDAAAADLAHRVEATRQAATAAQLRLHRLMGAAAGVSLPLPADIPHCGKYNTRYDEIFVTHMDPAARQLNELIPQLHAALAAEARQIAEADQWLSHVSQVRETANDGVGLLRSFELMAARRREFVEGAREYNQQIAAYSELAAPNQVEPQRLVSMLIRVSNPTQEFGAGGAAEVGASGVETASATEPVGASPDAAASAKNEPGRTRTFWRPFERRRNREHSILVHPLRSLIGRNRTQQE